MESRSLQSSTIATVFTRFPKNGILDRTLMFGQFLKFPRFCKYQLARKLKILDVKAQTSGTPKFSSQSVGAIPGDGDVKNKNLAFVAGATGRVGSRTVRELLKLGFRVRAAVRSAQRAEALVQSVRQIKLDADGVQAVERLEIIECDLEKPNQIGPALGNASVVLCCIGASEKEAFDITGPYRIDYLATKNLIAAATVANVDHFFMVSSLGTNKVGFPAAILNLFWGVLIWKRKAEEALIASGIPYTIVRPGGMERPTDAYKETHNLFLSEEDTLFGGQVSNLQVAELMAFMAKSRRLSYCKVVEVIAMTTAPLTPMDKLLEKIPSQRALPEELHIEDQSGPATKPDLAASEDVVPETSSSPIEQEPIEAKETGTKPLSPYTAYEDMKPPASPTPSSSKERVKPIDAVSKPDNLGTQSSPSEVVLGAAGIPQSASAVTGPLSPYTVYEDLKPPTSPSPTPSGPKEASSSAPPLAEAVSPSIGGNDVAQISDSPTRLSYNHSPYQVYEDLKPPTSPTPTAPDGSILSAPSNNGGPNTGNSSPTTAPMAVQEQLTEPKPRPLSPYAMYENLKPPTTPSPSSRK